MRKVSLEQRNVTYITQDTINREVCSCSIAKNKRTEVKLSRTSSNSNQFTAMTVELNSKTADSRPIMNVSPIMNCAHSTYSVRWTNCTSIFQKNPMFISQLIKIFIESQNARLTYYNGLWIHIEHVLKFKHISFIVQCKWLAVCKFVSS